MSQFVVREERLKELMTEQDGDDEKEGYEE